jgi:hypothetical protein
MIRLVRIELRRNTAVMLLPVVALLWLASPIARHLAPIALWTDRSTDIQSGALAVGPFAAGVAAWMASREHRRGTTELAGTTPLDPGLRAAAMLVATTLWAVLGYVAGGTALLVITSAQATWGHPVLLPLVVGLLAVIVAVAIGFALGHVFPGRFTAPLVAIGLLGLFALGVQRGFDGSLYGMLSPVYPSINLTISVFFPVRPDLALLQVLALVGVLAAALGVLASRTSHRRLGIAVVTAGVLLLGGAVGLVGSAHRDPQGAVVTALDSPAVAAPLPYTPVCSSSAVVVCVHPAYAAKLPVLDDAVNRLAAPLAGTPGLPVRVAEGPIYLFRDIRVTGDPPVLVIPPVFIQGNDLGFETVSVTNTLAVALVQGPGQDVQQASAVQRAVALYLLRQAGDPSDSHFVPTDPAVRAAASALVAMPAAERHAWFAAHIAAVRAGTISLSELP